MVRGFPPIITLLLFVVIWAAAYLAVRYMVLEISAARAKVLVISFAMSVVTMLVILLAFSAIAYFFN
jgi:hypothetical protein